MVALSDRLLMTPAEYLAWEPSQEGRYEDWDGEVVAMSGGTRTHNRILEDRLLLESIGVEITMSELYRQVQFEADNLAS